MRSPIGEEISEKKIGLTSIWVGVGDKSFTTFAFRLAWPWPGISMAAERSAQRCLFTAIVVS